MFTRESVAAVDSIDRLPRRFVCLMDVPTPYRAHLFEALSAELEHYGIEFVVWFMARSVRTRSWDIDISGWRFHHEVLDGVHPVFRGTTFHLNARLLSRLHHAAPDWLLVGGGWQVPSSALVLLTRRALLRDAVVIFWAEANVHSMQHRGALANSVRRFIVRNADAVAVPGATARQTVTDEWKLRALPFLPLPNVVDERLFGSYIDGLRVERAELRARYGIADGQRVMFWPARLRESEKGILRFLQTIEHVIQPRSTILIAGDGPDRARVEAWLASSAISERVRLLGWQSQEAIVQLYALADIMLLPSIRDRSPLAVVEALWAGLPLCISDRCGNWPESTDGHNGWVINPLDAEAVRQAFCEMQELDEGALRQRGARSREIAARAFSTASVVSTFVEAATALHGTPAGSRAATSSGQGE